MSAPQRRVPAAQRGARPARRARLAAASSFLGPARRFAALPRRSKSSRPAPSTAGGPHPVELAGLLNELTVRLLGADTLTHALDRLAAFGASALPGVVRCSVVLIGEGGPLTQTGAGRAGESFDLLQYAGSAGPGLEAARTRSLVISTDLAADERWPELTGAARSEGVRAAAVIPLDVRRTAVGAFSVYLDRDGDVGPDLLVTAMAVAGQAELLLGELRRREALTEGAEVDRAVGVIIAQRGCSVQEAYAVLQESSQRLGLDRRIVAERLVAAAARKATD
ncbi:MULTISPECIES: GAF and ANTAR domain-containing protein [Actinoplanes]|uniref:GAF and ANTAR domain-containing protein n=1 Tax=Actinoplanes TaxID=1865 RepID=UPI0005F27774|nr:MULTISPECIES: GAF and ANTAR domain-containing protein [Actinoplanes]GLY01375.1 hypothetical protein Acsp01_17540 [Actinoplanes sp. NBRC 101535]